MKKTEMARYVKAPRNEEAFFAMTNAKKGDPSGVDLVKETLRAAASWQRAADGDSNDAETDAGVELRDAAIALVRDLSRRNRQIAELLRRYEKKIAEWRIHIDQEG